MKVLSNNCVSTIKIPEEVRSGNGVDYNPVLDLYATIDYADGVSVWSPVSGKVTAECDLGLDGDLYMLFVPGDRIAISYSQEYRGGSIKIYSLEKGTFDSSELDIKVPSLSYPGALALSPERNILVGTTVLVEGSVTLDGGLYEICMDWDNLKVLKMRELCIPEDVDELLGIAELCCSPDFKVITAEYDEGFEKLSTCILSVAKVCFNSLGEDESEDDEKIEIKEHATITYYVLDGDEKPIDDITGFVHDGKNLIIANGDKIVLLESITEGSNAHLIASGVKPSKKVRELGLNLNHKGQLMVCEEKAIKLFEYNCKPRSLLDFCRCCVRKAIPTGYRDAVKGLEIPSKLKEYLLYK